MEKIKINYLNAEIEKIKEIQNCGLYYLNDDNWISTNDVLIETSLIKNAELNKKHKSGFIKSDIKTNDENCTVIFWIENYKIAIITKAKKRIREKTLKNILSELHECLQHAKQNFHANHDTLTGLYNRNGAQTELDKNSSYFLTHEKDEDESDQRIKILESIAVLSFDIDNFKQINDTYGHQIGDMVLSIFSNRLSFAVNNLQNEIESKLILSRPGGEEFELIAIKNLTRNILEIISNKLLREIRNPTIPIQEEIIKYQEKNKISIPQNIQEIKILASIGIASKTSSEENFDINGIVVELRQSADTALYRAKNDGKDCVRFFEDIRLKHGRIAEFHPQSELAIIDIGKSVNVKNGDIYSVYYPPFTGENSFIRDDGRSKKKLGDYIAVESAKIQVVHVQEQLSTCVIIEKQTADPIPIGSLLKSLTVGTKPHFFSSRQFQTNNGKPEDLIKNIELLLQKDNLLCIINLLPNIGTENFEQKSNLLIKYSSYISMILPGRTEVFLSSDDSMFIIIKSKSYYIEVDEAEDSSGEEDQEIFCLKVKDEINKTLLDLSKHFNFRAGIYLRCDHPEFSEVSPEICLHLSKAALNVSLRTSKKLNISYFEANQAILAWRRANNTRDAIADYCSFKKYGVSNLGMENQLGLTILANEDIENIELAELALTIANDENPHHDYYWANLGLIKSYMGKFSEAYELLLRMKDENKTTLTATYRIALAKSALESQKSNKLITNENLLELINWIDENYAAKSTTSNFNRLYKELMLQREKLLNI